MITTITIIIFLVMAAFIAVQEYARRRVMLAAEKVLEEGRKAHELAAEFIARYKAMHQLADDLASVLQQYVADERSVLGMPGLPDATPSRTLLRAEHLIKNLSEHKKSYASPEENHPAQS